MSPASTAPIRLLIVDDQPVILRGLSLMLGIEASVEVVGLANDGVEAVAMAKELRPDVIIMDLQMPRMNGVEATREITREVIGTRIVVLTTFDTDNLVNDAFSAGAVAYLLKDTAEEEVLSTVQAVHRGESYVSPEIARKSVGCDPANP